MTLHKNISSAELSKLIESADQSFVVMMHGEGVTAFIDGESVQLAIAMKTVMEEETDVSEPLEILVDIIMNELVTHEN